MNEVAEFGDTLEQSSQMAVREILLRLPSIKSFHLVTICKVLQCHIEWGGGGGANSEGLSGRLGKCMCVLMERGVPEARQQIHTDFCTTMSCTTMSHWNLETDSAIPSIAASSPGKEAPAGKQGQSSGIVCHQQGGRKVGGRGQSKVGSRTSGLTCLYLAMSGGRCVRPVAGLPGRTSSRVREPPPPFLCSLAALWTREEKNLQGKERL